MSASRSTQLLKLAVPLVKTHGFSREALSRSVLSLPSHEEPLSDTAVSALFGNGDIARRTLINAWLDEGLQDMEAKKVSDLTLRDALRMRLDYNTPVLKYLPEAFALIASPRYGIPPLDPMPGLKHAARVADEACRITGDTSLQLAWYSRRASLAVVYTAAELHQLTSPETAHAFLDSLLVASSSAKNALDEFGDPLIPFVARVRT